jgi:hypothetical protein
MEAVPMAKSKEKRKRIPLPQILPALLIERKSVPVASITSLQGRKLSIQTAALPREPFLPREKTSTNGVNGEKNRKVTLDFWLAAWHRFR